MFEYNLNVINTKSPSLEKCNKGKSKQEYTYNTDGTVKLFYRKYCFR